MEVVRPLRAIALALLPVIAVSLKPVVVALAESGLAIAEDVLAVVAIPTVRVSEWSAIAVPAERIVWAIETVRIVGSNDHNATTSSPLSLSRRI